MTILIVHWLADFVFQSDEVAKGKSSSVGILFQHAFIYTLVWIPAILLMAIMLNRPALFLFFPITFLSHALIDFYTSKANKQLYENKETHEFFVSIGLDQILHYIQLYLTFKFLFYV